MTLSISFNSSIDENDFFDGQQHDEEIFVQTFGGNDHVIGGRTHTTAYLVTGDDYFWVMDDDGGIFGQYEAESVTVYGGEGNDTMSVFEVTGTLDGGAGDDTYIIEGEDTAITVLEGAAGGTDTIRIALKSDQAYSIPLFVENLAIEGIYTPAWGYNYEDTDGSYKGDAGAGNGARVDGNALANLITGSDRSDTLVGGEGNDTLRGGVSNDRLEGGIGDDLLEGGRHADTLIGGEGHDRLLGGTENDHLYGEGGNDTLQGDAGADRLSGGSGNDTYVVTDALDTVVEGAGAGRDTVQTTLAAYTLAANVEDLDFTPVAGSVVNRVGTGNELGNKISGQTGNDFFEGMGGNDSLFGGAGHDTLHGGDGNDHASGSTGTDWLYGEGGNDTLLGGTGFDLLYGGEGNDSLDGGADGDLIYGEAGNDSMLGAAGNDTLHGGEGADTLRGGDGADRLQGNAGADRLHGDAGADLFVYLATGDSTAAARDIIYGFEKGMDRIDLSAIDANAGMAGDQAFAFTGAGSMFPSAGELWLTANLAGTTVHMDVSGDGVADMQILVSGVFGLAASDFVL
jgi:Ca2+-binding RTX toxin-like protein